MSYISSEKLEELLARCTLEAFTLADLDAELAIKENAKALAREVLELRKEVEDWKVKAGLRRVQVEDLEDELKSVRDASRWRSFAFEPPELAEGQTRRILAASVTKHGKSYCSPYITEVVIYRDGSEVVCKTPRDGCVRVPEYWCVMPKLPESTDLADMLREADKKEE